jgi:hypothetical protein
MAAIPAAAPAAAAPAYDGPPPETTIFLSAGGDRVPDSDPGWTYILEIYNLGNISPAQYDELKRRISTQASTTCQGIVNPRYVSVRFSMNDFLFVVRIKSGRGTLSIGFAIVEQKKDISGQAHLYIDVICALLSSNALSSYQRAMGGDAPSLKRGAGTILLSQIKNWAVRQNVQNGANLDYIELTALPYVAGYY